MGEYIILNPELIQWQTWRRYTASVACTFIYDFIYLCCISDAGAESEASGGQGAFMLYLTTLLCWVSFLFRPAVVGVLWYDSHNFLKIIKGEKREHVSSIGNAAPA